MTRNGRSSFLRRTAHRFGVLLGGVTLTLAFFLVLPLMQTISKRESSELSITELDLAQLEQPPQVEKPPDEPEPEDEPPEPELKEPTELLSLQEMEIALIGPSFGEGGFEGDYVVKLNSVIPGGEDGSAVFSLDDLDQQPRVLYQPGPSITARVRKEVPGTVWIIFIVDERGRVNRPKVQKSDHSAFEGPALAAVKQWKFEPGRRNGEPVRFRMRVPILFPEGL